MHVCCSGAVYRIPGPGKKDDQEAIQPMLPDGSVDQETLSSLTFRHDDIEENVLKRLQAYDMHYKGLRSSFTSVSTTIDASSSCDSLRRSATEFITIEHVHKVDPVPSWKLKDAAYEVIEVLKYRREPLIHLHQTDGKTFWVSMDELAKNTKCLLIHQDPAVFSTSETVVRPHVEQFAKTPLLYVDSPEPIHLLASLSVGIQYPIELEDANTANLLVITGPSCSGKSTLIDMVCSNYPEKVEVLSRVSNYPAGRKVIDLGIKEFSHCIRTNKLVCSYQLFGVDIGVLKEEIERAKLTGKLCLLELDLPGCSALRDAEGVEFKQVSLDLDMEALDRRMRSTEPHLQEEDIQKRLRQTISDLEDQSRGEAQNHDYVVNGKELHACCSVLMDIICQFWPLPVVPSSCNLLVDHYEWGKEGPTKSCRRLSCMASRATSIELPRGRHLLGMQVDQEFLHCIRVLSNTSYQIDDSPSILRQKENLSVQQFQGNHPALETGSWCILFRYTYDIVEACKVSADLKLNRESAQR